jgi:hypothetical protein
MLLKVVNLSAWYKNIKVKSELWTVTQVERYFVQRLQRIIVGRSTIVLTGCGEGPAGVVSMDISAVSRTCVIATSWVLCHLWSNICTAQFLTLKSISIRANMENICVQHITKSRPSKLFSDRCSNRLRNFSISEVYKIRASWFYLANCMEVSQ